MYHPIFKTETPLSEMMDCWPQTLPVFIEHHMACIGCPLAPFGTLAEACTHYKIHPDCFLQLLEEAISPALLQETLMGKITTYYKNDMLFESKLGDYSLIIDVPPAMGGQGRGPTPPEIFIASLGSCVGALVAQFCNRGNIVTEGMTVDVTFNKVDNPTRLTDIKVRVNLPFGECENRAEALRRVAKHCPVHETIETLDGIDFEIVGSDVRELQPA